AGRFVARSALLATKVPPLLAARAFFVVLGVAVITILILPILVIPLELIILALVRLRAAIVVIRARPLLSARFRNGKSRQQGGSHGQQGAYRRPWIGRRNGEEEWPRHHGSCSSI